MKYYLVKTVKSVELLYGFHSEDEITFEQLQELFHHGHTAFELKKDNINESVVSLSREYDEEQFLDEHDKIFPEMKDLDPKYKLMICDYNALKR